MPGKKDDSDDLVTVTAMADRLKLKGRERSEYIHKHMLGFGYKAKRTYELPDEDERSGGFFGRKRDDDDDDDDF